MSHTTLTVPAMDELPRRHDITIRVAKEAGHHPDPAAFAIAASRAAAGRNASVVSAHTATEVICVVSVPAAGRPDAVAVALAVVADALKGAEPASAPGQLADGARHRAQARRASPAGAGCSPRLAHQAPDGNYVCANSSGDPHRLRQARASTGPATP
jgi:hypothetical protein